MGVLSLATSFLCSSPFIWFFEFAFSKAFIRSVSSLVSVLPYRIKSRACISSTPILPPAIQKLCPPAIVNLSSPYPEGSASQFSWPFPVLMGFPCVRLPDSISFTIPCLLSIPCLECLFPLTPHLCLPRLPIFSVSPFLKVLLRPLWSSVSVLTISILFSFIYCSASYLFLYFAVFLTRFTSSRAEIDNFFWKASGRKWFLGLWAMLFLSLLSATQLCPWGHENSHRQYTHEWVWLFSNKTLFQENSHKFIYKHMWPAGLGL